MPSEPIRIVGLFEDAVSTSASGDHITTIVLRLSAVPAEDWTEAFHHEWALTSYPRKRSARWGSVHAASGAMRTGVILSSSPQDYLDKHRRYVEDAVERANERVRLRDRLRDRTLADAAQAIREINRSHYGGAGHTAAEAGGSGPEAGLRLAV